MQAAQARALDEERRSGLVSHMIREIGDDPLREGVRDTPARVVASWTELFKGYSVQPESLIKLFVDGAEQRDQTGMVIVRNIPVRSFCEHHMLPIFGDASIGYIANKEIVGLSKMSRIVDAYARRLQVQERLTDQIADLLHEHLAPTAVGVIIRARHFCMEYRGVKDACTSTITSAMRGQFMLNSVARQEFLMLEGGK